MEMITNSSSNQDNMQVQSPDAIASDFMWKLVMYVTGGVLLWSYLRTRSKGE